MDENRSSCRGEVRLSCPCRLSDGVTLDLELLDVSTRGCRVRVDSLPLYVGQSLTIFPEGIEEFTGTVRGADNEFAGIEFDHDLPHPVFERICSHAPSGDADGAQVEPAPAAVQSETIEESGSDQADNDAGQPSGFGSLNSITIGRRRQPAFGNKAVVLR